MDSLQSDKEIRLENKTVSTQYFTPDIVSNIEPLLHNNEIILGYPRGRHNHFVAHPAKVTAFIPVYNAAQNLVRCLESISAQTFENLHVIVVDNNSTDDTFQIACRFAHDHANFVVYRNHKNVGRIQNWNRCLELAHGEYLKPVMTNDFLTPTCIAELSDILDSYQNVVLVRSSLSMLFEGGRTEFMPLFPESKLIPGETAIRYCLEKGNISAGPTAQLFRSDIIEKNNLRFDIQYSWAADFDFSLRLFEYGDFAYLRRPLYFFDASAQRFFNRSNLIRQFDEEANVRISSFQRKSSRDDINQLIVKRLEAIRLEYISNTSDESSIAELNQHFDNAKVILQQNHFFVDKQADADKPGLNSQQIDTQLKSSSFALKLDRTGPIPNIAFPNIEFHSILPQEENDLLISVIIPCFNQAQFLSEAVESIVHQTFTNWEIVIVNDGSPDNTTEIANSLILKFPNKKIRLLQKENGGLSDARNFGISHATGNWILPLDSDDLIKRELLFKAFEIIVINPGTNLIYCNMQEFGVKTGNWAPIDYSSKTILDWNTFPYASLYKKDLWEKAGGYYKGIPWGAEDWNFWIELSKHNIVPVRIPENLFLYRTANNSMYDKMLPYFEEVKAFIITLHPELYGFEKVMEACIKIQSLSDASYEKLNELIIKHPDMPMPYIWLGIYNSKHDQEFGAKCFKEGIKLADISGDRLPGIILSGILGRNTEDDSTAILTEESNLGSLIQSAEDHNTDLNQSRVESAIGSRVPGNDFDLISQYVLLHNEMNAVVIGCESLSEIALIARQVNHVYAIAVDEIALNNAVGLLSAKGIYNFIPVLSQDWEQKIPDNIDFVYYSPVSPYLDKDIIEIYFHGLRRKLVKNGKVLCRFFTNDEPESGTDKLTVNWSIDEISEVAENGGLTLITFFKDEYVSSQRWALFGNIEQVAKQTFQSKYLKICLVTSVGKIDPGKSNAGLETAIIKTAEALARLGHDVAIAAFLRTNIEFHNGVKYLSFDKWKNREYPDYLDDIDILAFASGPDLKCYKYVRESVPKIVLFHHQEINFHGSTNIKFLLNETADAIICVSEKVKSNLLQAGIAEQKVKVIHNGVDLQTFYPHPVKRNPMKIIFVGALVPEKNPHLLIEVFLKLEKVFPDLELHFYGNAALWDSEEYISESQVRSSSGNIYFHGCISHDELANEYSNASICVIPSKYESFSLVSLEAQACGCIPLAHDVGGISETMRNTETGYLYAPNDPAILYKILHLLLTNVSKLAPIRENAGKWVKDNFSWEKTATRYQDLFNSVIASKKSEQSTVSEISAPENMRALVSVIIPCYNYGNFLPDAVESVINQTYKDFEIIIINDGSTDNTAETATRLIAQYPQFSIKLINQENSGRPAIARNNGIKIARGEYILPLDADDKLPPDAIEKYMHIASQSKTKNIVVFGWMQFFGTREEIWKTSNFDYNELLRKNRVPSSSLFHKSVWEQNRGYSPVCDGYEDWNFWIEAVENHTQFVCVNSVTSLYRESNTESLMNSGLQNHEWNYAIIILNHPALYEPEEVRWAKYYVYNKSYHAHTYTSLVDFENYPLAISLMTLHYPELFEKSFSERANAYLQNLNYAAFKSISGSELPLITMLSVTYNVKRQINMQLEKIRNFTQAPVEVLIVDLGSTDGTKEYIKSQSNVRLIEAAQNTEYKTALDIGFSFVRTKYTVVLDAEAYPVSSEWIDTLITPLNDDCLISGIHLHKNYVHPACLAIATNTFYRYRLTFEPKFSDDNNKIKSGDSDWETGEYLSAKVMEAGKRINLIPPNDTNIADGSIFGGCIYYNPSAVNPPPAPKENIILESYGKNVSLPEESEQTNNQPFPQKSSANPYLSVVITTYNRKEELFKCLDAFCAQSIDPSQFEVIVVDDGSFEPVKNIEEIYKDRLSITCHFQTNAGLASARNKGIALASGIVIVPYDDDNFPHPDCLKSHYDFHMSHPAMEDAMLANMTWAPDLEITPFMHYITEVNPTLWSYKNVVPGEVLRFGFLWGGCSSYKKELIDKAGGFNPIFRFGYEDTEAELRMREHGLRVYFNPQAMNYVMSSISYDGFCKRLYRQGQSLYRFVSLYPGNETVLRYASIGNAHEVAAKYQQVLPKLEKVINELLEIGWALPPKDPDTSKPTLEILYQYLSFAFTYWKSKGISDACNIQPGYPTPGAVKKNEKALSILIVSKELPFYDRSSGNFRLFQIIQILVSQGHAVTFLARPSFRQINDIPYIETLKSIGVSVFKIADESTFIAGNNERHSLKEFLAAGSFDVAYLMFYAVAELYLEPLKTFSPKTRVIVDSVDIHFLREQRQSAFISENKQSNKNQNKSRELSVYQKADMVVTLTDVDTQALLSEIPKIRTALIPNIHPVIPPANTGFSDRHDILFVGGFTHEPNIDAVEYFCTNIWPIIASELPECRFIIAGNAPPDRITRFASDRIIVTGYVQNLNALLSMCRISVAPLRYGAGMKGKVGEALSYGLPVVGTTISAEGMGLEHAKHLFIADAAEDFAKSVITLYQDQAIWNVLSRNGKAFMERRFSPGAVSIALQSMLHSLFTSSDQSLAAESYAATHFSLNDQHSTKTISIKCCSPSRQHLGWGDTHYADSLMQAFERKGHSCRVDCRNEWYTGLETDIVIHLKGNDRYVTQPASQNIQWIISHPESVQGEELDEYDLVFCASETFVNKISPVSRTPIYFLPQASDGLLFKPVDHAQHDFDVLFIGNNYPARRGHVSKIIANLSKLGLYKLAVIGQGWKDYIDESFILTEYIAYNRLPEIYSRAKIVLNDHHVEMQIEGFVNNRTFDLALMKVFQISDQVDGLDAFSVVSYSDIDDLKNKIDYYLNNEQAREKVIEENFDKCRAFTFDNRVDTIWEYITNPANNQRRPVTE